MSFKVIVFFALLAVAFAERPHVGLRVPFFPYVVGGSEAPKGSYPYIVSLQWGFTSKTSHFCAGSILTADWVITAGHCIKAIPPIGKFVVKAGKHNIKVQESTEQTASVARSYVHEQYQGGVGPYDIALIKLKTPLTFNNEVQAINLPQAESEPSGDALLCGWGSISDTKDPKMPDTLQHVDLHFVERDICHESVERLTGSSPVHETNVCTGPLTGGISACSGDSGGPLIKRYEDKSVLTGIVSWGIVPCGTEGAPSVYTKVSVFNSWIQNKMAKY